MPKLGIIELTDEQKQTITETFLKWAGTHPQPDEPILTVWSESGVVEISPRRILEDIENSESLTAKVIFRMIAIGMTPMNGEKPETLDNMLDPFRSVTDYGPAQEPK